MKTSKVFLAFADTQTHYTKAEWEQKIRSCGANPTTKNILDLIYSETANATMTRWVNAAHLQRPHSDYSYFKNKFPTKVKADWSGVVEIGKRYHPAHIPFSLGIFAKTMQICNGPSNDGCITDYCKIPQGGYSTLPAEEMYKTGLETDPFCIANIRTSQHALDHVKRVVEERFRAEERVMHMIYTLAAIRMLGHKWVLEYEEDANGNAYPVQDNSPYNVMRAYRYNYLNTLFPSCNPNKIAGLDAHAIERWGKGLVMAGNDTFVKKGSRGNPIWELWVGEDWYRDMVLSDGEWIEKMRSFEQESVIPGYTPNAPTVTVGNFAIHHMMALPRFAVSADHGGLTIVQPETTTEVEVGYRTLNNRDWENAPFVMACAIGNGLGNMLSRPTLSADLASGIPIKPIVGTGQWQVWNEYDRECNPERNMPKWQWRLEMGFKVDNPEAGSGAIFRGQRFNIRPIDTCNLRPVITVSDSETTCSFTTIGCIKPERADNSKSFFASAEDLGRAVLCNSRTCGTNLIHRITFKRENIDAITPGEYPFNCACGSTVKLLINNAEGEHVRIQPATVIEFAKGNIINPNPTLLVLLSAPLGTAECVAKIICDDSTPNSGLVNSTVSVDNNTMKVMLDSLLGCEVGGSVTVGYFNQAGVSLGTIQATITEANHAAFAYTLDAGANVGGVDEPEEFSENSFEGAVRMVVTCQ